MVLPRREHCRFPALLGTPAPQLQCLLLLPSPEICPKLLQPHSMSNCPLLHTEAGAQTHQPPSRMVTERHQVMNSTCVSYTAMSQSLPAPLASEPSRAILINHTAFCPSHWADSCFPCLFSHRCSSPPWFHIFQP